VSEGFYAHHHIKRLLSMTATYFHSGKADAAPYADELESYMSRRSHEANKAKLDDVLRPKYIDEKGSFNTSWI